MVRGMMRLTNPDPASHTIVLACFADEDHDLPLHGVALRLASWGVAHVSLGARTPPVGVADAVASLHPSAVGLSLTTPADLAAARALVTEYAAACGNTPWFVGGSGTAAIADAVRAAGGLPHRGRVRRRAPRPRAHPPPQPRQPRRRSSKRGPTPRILLYPTAAPRPRLAH